MKRQHPDNPELFWCPKCETYKVRESFGKTKRLPGYCLACRHRPLHKIRCSTCGKEEMVNYGSHAKYCKTCRSEKERQRRRAKQRKIRETEEGRKKLCEIAKQSYLNHRKDAVARSVAYIKKRRVLDPNWAIKKRREHKARCISEIRDTYLISNMKRDGIIVTPETIELKRQQIIMKRTLKQFKEWRKQYEPNNPDVQREQRENEETDGRQGHGEP